MIKRYSTSILGAITITFFLFLGMHFLIAPDNFENPEVIKPFTFTIGKVRDPEKPHVKDRKPEIIKDVIKPFVMPKLTQKDTNKTTLKIGSLIPNATADKILPKGIGLSDGEIQPIRKFKPAYPRGPQSRGIEGYVIVEFTVNKMGAVENAVVIESTNSAFEKSSLRAVAKYKYKPRVIDGVAVETSGVMEKISFKLEDG